MYVVVVTEAVCGVAVVVKCIGINQRKYGNKETRTISKEKDRIIMCPR